MLDFIFELVCENKYDVMVLTIENDTLYGIPCDDAMSGYYPVYDKKVQLSELKVTFEDISSNNGIGILLRKDVGNRLEFKIVENSWDGFQPLG